MDARHARHAYRTRRRTLTPKHPPPSHGEGLTLGTAWAPQSQRRSCIQLFGCSCSGRHLALDRPCGRPPQGETSIGCT